MAPAQNRTRLPIAMRLCMVLQELNCSKLPPNKVERADEHRPRRVGKIIDLLHAHGAPLRIARASRCSRREPCCRAPPWFAPMRARRSVQMRAPAVATVARTNRRQRFDAMNLMRPASSFGHLQLRLGPRPEMGGNLLPGDATHNPRSTFPGADNILDLPRLVPHHFDEVPTQPTFSFDSG
jgi:hypothetical protein